MRLKSTDSEMKNEKKQKRIIVRAISTIFLSLAICLSFVACKEEDQKRKPSGSSGDSVKTEIELPDVDF